MVEDNIKFRQREAEMEGRQVQQVMELEEIRLKNDLQIEQDRMKTQEMLERMRYLSEEDEKKRKYGKEKKNCRKNAPIKEAYISIFEEVMREAEVSQREWPHLLQPLLTGTALSAYVNDVPEEAKRDWDLLREAFMNDLGSSADQCRLDFFNLCKKYGDSWQETARKIDFYTERIICGCTNIKKVCQMFSLSKLFPLFPAEALNHVELWTPKSITEAANIISDFYKRQSSDRHQRPWTRQGQSNSHKYGQRMQIVPKLRRW